MLAGDDDGLVIGGVDPCLCFRRGVRRHWQKRGKRGETSKSKASHRVPIELVMATYR
jgi:hypothetical protein